MSKMEFSKPIQIIELKEAGDEWTVDGYVSTFGNVDLGNDMVMPGAFKDTLKNGPKVRFLLSHDPRLVLGVPKKLKEDSKGLFGSFKISKTQLGQDTHQLLLDSALDSFSIGYSAEDWKMVDGDVRELHKVTLYEASLVPLAMNQEALVTGVKEYSSFVERVNFINKEIQELLNDLRGLSNDHPLTDSKRQEVRELLEWYSGMDSGMDAVRSNFQSLIEAAPQSVKLVENHWAKYKLDEIRKRHSFLEE